MIRINLLAPEKPRARAAGFSLASVALAGQQLTAACAIILIAGAAFIGWRYWQIQQESAALDQQIASAQTETIQLRSVLVEVQQFEERRAQLQQRVGLIETLRRDQTGPVHMLDEISRALPPTLWLTDLKQSLTGGEVVIDGRCTMLTGLSDFVTNLERSGYFKRSVEILNTQLELSSTAAEVIKFSIKAQFDHPVVAAADPPTVAKPAN
jgi:type IV pilus assembly protein PilN